MEPAERKALTAALQWHLDAGACDLMAPEPVDKTQDILKPSPAAAAEPSRPPQAGKEKNEPLLGTAEAREKAIEMAREAGSLGALEQALRDFDGLAIKKSAIKLVFADGNPAARIMLIGEAPDADEDRQGKPFTGASGQLLDKILAAIGLDRRSADPECGVYITNLLNWRPPGGRTPNDGEIEVSLPFIEKHIALAEPDILVLCGSITARALLGETRNISKLRGQWHSYRVRTAGLGIKEKEIPALAVYHPEYLLQTPLQKRAMWHDMLMLKQKCHAA